MPAEPKLKDYKSQASRDAYGIKVISVGTRAGASAEQSNDAAINPIAYWSYSAGD